MEIDKETQEYYDLFFDLFTHPGWKQYVKEAGEYLEELDTLSNYNTANDFFYNKGRVSELKSTVSFETATRNAYEDMNEEAL